MKKRLPKKNPSKTRTIEKINLVMARGGLTQRGLPEGERKD